ncbi:MAG TPA: glycosyltransferase [Burkholderiaceae bacterium]|nr:glycosyltransferase [Burkholderiaceae bacterium]
MKAQPTSERDGRLRVAFVITGLGTGGAEGMLERLILALSPSVLPCVISLTDLGEVGPRLRARGVRVHALGMHPRAPSPLAMARLVFMLRSLRPDVVQTWMYHADLLGGVAARLAGVKAVIWGLRHSNLDPALNKHSTLRVMRVCARLSGWLPARIACAAQRTREAHIAAGYRADRMVVLPNGVDLQRFRPDPAARHAVRSELGLTDETPLVGVFGRFDTQKNHRGFATAFAEVLARRPGVHAVLAGTRIDAANEVLREWLQRAGVSSACHLLGRRGDMPRLMAALDVLALPSLGEAFPNVVGEAMACGVPCAVTDVGDAADIVGPLGRVVASDDMSSLAQAVVDLLAVPPAERDSLSRRLVERVREHFDIHAVAQRYEIEYRTLAGALTPRPA